MNETEAAARKLRDMIAERQIRRLKIERLARGRWRVLDQHDFGHLFSSRDEARAFLRALKKGPQPL